MKLWIDADACPKVIKEIIFKAAVRLKVETTIVANHRSDFLKSPFIKFVQVTKEFDAADKYIVENISENDLVITADIPLASLVIKKNAFALNPRGTFYTQNNIDQILATRNLMDELRQAGQIKGGPSTINNKDKQQFANALDRHLTKYVN